MLALYVSANHRYVASLFLKVKFNIFHCAYGQVRFRHKHNLVRVRKRLCFASKYQLLSPHSWLEGCQDSVLLTSGVDRHLIIFKSGHIWYDVIKHIFHKCQYGT